MFDEGRPLGVALQEEASNRLKWLWLRVMVISVQEKAGLNRSGVCWRGEVHESHMRRRERVDAVKTGVQSLFREECGRYLFTARTTAGVYVARLQQQASTRNMGTSRFDAKEEIQVAKPQG